MIIKLNEPKFHKKIIIFDYDWTLVVPKNNSVFSKSLDDWNWISKDVPDIIKKYYKKNYGIYIATNQSKEMKIEQIKNVMSLLEIPLTICIANNKNDYKPNIDFFKEAFTDSSYKKINLDESIMVGDALGRINDHSDCDLEFSKKLGVKIYAPEDIFIKKNLDEINYDIKENKNQEIVIMVGFQGCGKTTLVNNVFLPQKNYNIIHGDDYKTSKKMIEVADELLKKGQSIVFDSTNPSIKKRKEFIDIAKKYNIDCRCIYINCSMSNALIRNNMREKPIPKIALYMFKKKFEQPDEGEGCEVIII
jgi:bifunctional polynucleotide phosphatase/kinase